MQALIVNQDQNGFRMRAMGCDPEVGIGEAGFRIADDRNGRESQDQDKQDSGQSRDLLPTLTFGPVQHDLGDAAWRNRIGEFMINTAEA